MVSKTQVVNAIRKYIENDMLPCAKTNIDRIALRGASAVLVLRPDALLSKIFSNPIVGMLGVVDGEGNVDIDLLRELLPTAIGNDTIGIHYKVFPWDVEEYGFSLNAEDIKKIFTYL